MISITVGAPAATNWPALIAPVLSAFSFFLAMLAFVRSSRVAEFQLCTKLSEQIDEKWSELHGIKRAAPYKHKLVDILNHYERCATLINEFRILRGRSIQSLEHQILECLERNWKEKYVRDTFEDARSSSETYKELSELMKKSSKFCFG